MAQNKYKLPEDVKATALHMVRGYVRRRAWYHAARESIIHGSTCRYITYTVTVDGHSETRRQYFDPGSLPGKPTEDKVIRLARLDETPDAKRLRAVERALLRVGLDIADDAEREKLRLALCDSCIEGRRFVFEHRNLCVGKTNFYKRRSLFLYEIAKSTDFL